MRLDGRRCKPFSGLRLQKDEDALSPGFQSKPWAEISERFQRYCCAQKLSVRGDLLFHRES